MAKAKSSKTKTPAGNPAFSVGFTKKVSNPVRCGVVGLGRIGWCHHSEIIRKHGGFELTAVCDIEEERLREAKEATGCATYRRLEDLLANKEVELVVVATQSIDHEPMAIKALKAGRHVLCEKPSAQSAKGIRRMIAASKKSGALLTMHHNYRLNPEFLHVREIIQSGALGRVIRLKRRVQNFARRNDWQVLRKYGGGMTGNWGIHLVDQCLQLLDSPIQDVWGDVKRIFNPGDAEDDIKALIRGKSGMTIDIDMTSACAAPEPTWCVMGTHGTLWILDGKLSIKRFAPSELPKIAVNDLRYAIGRQYGVIPAETIPWKLTEVDINPKGKYQTYYDNLYAAVRKGKRLLVEPESALVTYEVLDRVRKGSPFAPDARG